MQLFMFVLDYCFTIIKLVFLIYALLVFCSFYITPVYHFSDNDISLNSLQAFVSCHVGIGHVGFALVGFGVTDALFSFIAGSIEKYTGRVFLLLLAFTINIGEYRYGIVLMKIY